MTSLPHLSLQQGLIEMGFEIPLSTQQSFIDYLHLLQKWNHTYNLTAIRTLDEMVIRHLLDSLAIGPYLVGDRIIDVGTGAGLPGIPLALCYPNKHFTLLDSNGKKCRFLLHAQQQLGLSNITVIKQRVEQFSFENGFTSIVSRAFSSLREMLQVTCHLLSENGCFLAMKGVYPKDELADIPQTFTVNQVYALSIPLLNAERHLVSLTMRKDYG